MASMHGWNMRVFNRFKKVILFSKGRKLQPEEKQGNYPTKGQFDLYWQLLSLMASSLVFVYVSECDMELLYFCLC